MAALGFPWIITPVLIAIGTTIVSVIAPISSVAIPWIGIAGRVGVSLLIGSVVYLTVNQYLGRPDEDQLPNNLRPQRGWRGIFVPLLSSLGVILIGWQLRTTGTIWALIHLDLIAIAGLILLLIKVLVLITVFFGTVLLGICILLVILLVIPVFVGLAADDLKYGVSWMLTLEIGLLLVTGSLTKIVGSIVRIAGHKSQATAKLIPLPTLSSAAVTITTHPLIVIALGFLLGGLLIVSTVGILRLLLFQIPREYTSNVTTRPPSVYILGLYTLIGSFLFGFHTLIPQLLPQLTTTHTYSVLTALVWSAIPGLISLLYLLLRLIARADDILRRISHFVTAWEYRLNTTYQAGWRLLTQLQTSVGNARIQPMRTLQSLPYRIMTKLTQIGRRILTWLVTKYW